MQITSVILKNDDDNLIALTKTRNEPKRAETSQNQPKRPKKKLRNDPTRPKISKLEKSGIF